MTTAGQRRADLEVLVVGGGLVGAVAALGVAATGRRVGLVDRASPLERQKASLGTFGMDIRNIACSPASRSLLEQVGVWQALAAAPYRRMEVWEERGTSALEFTAAEAGRTELGWILENSPTVLALWERIETHPGIDVLLGAVTAVEHGPDRVTVTVGRRSVYAKLLIGVDGARSTVRELVRTETDVLATGQQALATIVRTERGHDGVALQRFLLDGPLALLPSRVPDLSSVVWSQSPVQAQRRRELDGAAFCAEIEAAIEARLGRVTAVDERIVFPLAQHVVRDFNPADRVLLIGDAARVLHPLAGLGANVGFEDVRDLLGRLGSLPRSADPGSRGIWRAFARKRRVRAQLMVGAMAGFRHAYAEGSPALTWLRNGAVSWVNRTAAVKRQVIREAMGLGPLAGPW